MPPHSKKKSAAWPARRSKQIPPLPKQAVAQYRREIAKLKRQLRDQEKKIAFLESQERKAAGAARGLDGTTEGARVFGPFGQGPAAAAGLLGGRLRQAGGRVAVDHLQLGTRQVAASAGTTGRAGRRPRHRQTRGAGQAGDAERRESKVLHGPPSAANRGRRQRSRRQRQARAAPPIPRRISSRVLSTKPRTSPVSRSGTSNAANAALTWPINASQSPAEIRMPRCDVAMSRPT